MVSSGAKVVIKILSPTLMWHSGIWVLSYIVQNILHPVFYFSWKKFVLGLTDDERARCMKIVEKWDPETRRSSFLPLVAAPWDPRFPNINVARYLLNSSYGFLRFMSKMYSLKLNPKFQGFRRMSHKICACTDH